MPPPLLPCSRLQHAIRNPKWLTPARRPRTAKRLTRRPRSSCRRRSPPASPPAASRATAWSMSSSTRATRWSSCAPRRTASVPRSTRRTRASPMSARVAISSPATPRPRPSSPRISAPRAARPDFDIPTHIEGRRGFPAGPFSCELPEQGFGRRCVATVAVYSLKGGVGKTTLAVNLAWCSATLSARRTLLWDLDPQAASTFLIGPEGKTRDRAQAVFTHDVEPRKLVQHTAVERLDLIPADTPLREIGRASCRERG